MGHAHLLVHGACGLGVSRVVERASRSREGSVVHPVRPPEPHDSDQRERRLLGEVLGPEDAAVPEDDPHLLRGEPLLRKSGRRDAVSALEERVCGVCVCVRRDG